MNLSELGKQAEAMASLCVEIDRVSTEIRNNLKEKETTI